jgi:LysR family glycine cleavage system transcriptional activator
VTRSLPSTAALQAFESAAFHLSVTQAARELNLTQGAVSRQIRALEEHLGVELFTRQRQRIRLSQAGTQYLEHVRAAFDRLEAAEIGLRAMRRGGGVLQLALLPTYGTQWLIPRFPSFAKRHPAVQVHFTTRLRPFDFATEDLDAGIHYGEEHWPGARLDKLMDEEVIAVCTPDYRAQLELKTVDDLRRATLLQISTRPHAFHEFLQAKSVVGFDGRRGPRFEHHSMVLQAALAGLGVALLPAFVVADSLRRQMLVEAVADPRHLTGKSYWLVYPEDRAELPALAAFRTWLLAEHGRPANAP